MIRSTTATKASEEKLVALLLKNFGTKRDKQNVKGEKNRSKWRCKLSWCTLCKTDMVGNKSE